MSTKCKHYSKLLLSYCFPLQSVHSNAIEKNRVLYTLLQHGVETTVDRSQKNSRIINWIRHGQPNEIGLDEPAFLLPGGGGKDIESMAKTEKHFDQTATNHKERFNIL